MKQRCDRWDSAGLDRRVYSDILRFVRLDINKKFHELVTAESQLLGTPENKGTNFKYVR